MKTRTKLLVAVGVLVAFAAAAAAALYGGVYDIAATNQHLAPTYKLLDVGMRQSVRRRAADIEVPPLDDAKLVERGLVRYREHCVPCHGAPGVAPAAFALGMTPVPASLVHTAREWKPAELFWVINFGIKMTGMPAWQLRLEQHDLWAIVAFLQKLPALSPADYRRLSSVELPQTAPRDDVAPDAVRGKLAVEQYGCVTCHRIPGIVGPNAPVGPPLNGIGARTFIAGLLPNTPQNMVRWLREPQAVHPDSAMPDLGVTVGHARDMAAYLSTIGAATGR